jgi:hypothetical protein
MKCHIKIVHRNLTGILPENRNWETGAKLQPGTENKQLTGKLVTNCNWET